MRMPKCTREHSSFRSFSTAPLLKRDLVYREQFNLYEVERMLSELGVDRGDADDRRRDPPARDRRPFEGPQAAPLPAWANLIAIELPV